MKNVFFALCALVCVACSSMNYQKTVDQVDLPKFMGKWYVIAGRLTFLEKGAHNAIEEYTWNQKEERIDISFTFNKDSFDGKLKSLPQKGWVENQKTKAYWKVSPFWPLKFDYLIIDLADDYSWTAVGVPSGKYLWIMSKDWNLPKQKVDEILARLQSKGYPTEDVKFVPQKH